MIAPTPSILVLLVCAAACGARSDLGAPGRDAGPVPPDAASEAGARPDCGIECTIGHECCAGGCDGPAVPVPNDCCPCLPGEVSSFACGHPCPG